MNLNYTFPMEFTDSTNYYFYEQGFSKEELELIESSVSEIPWQKAVAVGGGEDIRDSRIKWVPQNEQWRWLYKKLCDMAIQANDALWKFDLNQIPEQIQYTEYNAPSGHYDWHVDIGPGVLSCRKISITVQLSEPDEYEGGELQLFRGGSSDGPHTEALKKAGCVFIFPSYLMHRVKPITDGTRKSFVLWLGGGHYK